jgi:hypothetical protein
VRRAPRSTPSDRGPGVADDPTWWRSCGHASSSTSPLDNVQAGIVPSVAAPHRAAPLAGVRDAEHGRPHGPDVRLDEYVSPGRSPRPPSCGRLIDRARRRSPTSPTRGRSDSLDAWRWVFLSSPRLTRGGLSRRVGRARLEWSAPRAAQGRLPDGGRCPPQTPVKRRTDEINCAPEPPGYLRELADHHRVVEQARGPAACGGATVRFLIESGATPTPPRSLRRSRRRPACSRARWGTSRRRRDEGARAHAAATDSRGSHSRSGPDDGLRVAAAGTGPFGCDRCAASPAAGDGLRSSAYEPGE